MEDMIGQGGRGDPKPKRKQKHLNLNLFEYLVNGLELETERSNSNSNHDSSSNSIHSAPPGGIMRQLNININNTASRRSNSLTDHNNNTSAVGQRSGTLSDLLSDLDDDDEDEDDDEDGQTHFTGVSVYVPQNAQRQYRRSRRALNSTYMLPLIIILVGTAITLCHLRYHHLQSLYNSTQEPSKQSLMGLNSIIVQDNIFHLMIATIMLAICILAKRLIFFWQQQRRDNKEALKSFWQQQRRDNKEALKSSISYPETVDNIA